MNVLVDTSVWSLALRRRVPKSTSIERELAELVREGRIVMVGPIRQELLSGLRSEPQFRTLCTTLRAFNDAPLERADYEEAAACHNRCRAAGVQGGATDFLLCSVALRRGLPIFAVDRDFEHYAPILGFKLYAARDNAK